MAEESSITEEDIQKAKKAQLKEMCETCDLATSGNKRDLQDRLYAYITGETPSEEEAEAEEEIALEEEIAEEEPEEEPSKEEEAEEEEAPEEEEEPEEEEPEEEEAPEEEEEPEEEEPEEEEPLRKRSGVHARLAERSSNSLRSTIGITVTAANHTLLETSQNRYASLLLLR
jgi:outer membrane biosynthesis protein TonB